MFGQDRAGLRRFFLEVFARREDGATLEPLQKVVADVIGMHPEYHGLLADAESVHRDTFPEAGQTNPFLHMAMHVTIAEQLAADRPAGLRAAYLGARRHFADGHELEHAVMECLGTALWEAQRAGRAPDEAAYLRCVQALAGRGGSPR